MTEHYPWYSIIEGNGLRQGDIIFDCLVIVPSNGASDKPNVELEAELLTYDVVIMSQSCDLENDKPNVVLVCPHWSFKEFSNKEEYLKSTKGKTDLQRGNIPGYHVLNRCDLNDWLPDLRVVDFRNVYGLPVRYLKAVMRSARAKAATVAALPRASIAGFRQVLHESRFAQFRKF